MIKALLFDLDGVLVDAMDLHEEAFLSALRAYGGAVLSTQEHRERYAGLPTKKKLEALVHVGLLDPRHVEAVAQAKQRLTFEYMAQRLRQDPGRINLLRHFMPQYLLGCVTNCIKRTSAEMLQRAGLFTMLQCVITNEDVKEPKPSKEPYQKACQVLGIQPEEALVFEDHDIGMTSAFNAGCNARQIRVFRELTVEIVWDAIREADLALKAQTEPGE